jgi:hypothetical protein
VPLQTVAGARLAGDVAQQYLLEIRQRTRFANVYVPLLPMGRLDM